MCNVEGAPCEGFCKVNVTTELYVPKYLILYYAFNGSQKGRCDKVQVVETVLFLNSSNKI